MTPSNTFRRWVLFSSTVIGALALAATPVMIFIVGRFGSPTPLLLLFLLCGPVALLPCVLFDMWKPSLGGITLCSLSLVEAGFIALNNQRPQGFAIHDAALGSLCLAFPMFVIGTLLFRSSKLDVSWLNWVWLIEVFVAASATGYFLWHVGAAWPPDRDVDDAEPPVQHVQRLGAVGWNDQLSSHDPGKITESVYLQIRHRLHTTDSALGAGEKGNGTKKEAASLSATIAACGCIVATHTRAPESTADPLP